MSEKVFISIDNTATIVCPKCEKSKTENVSKYLETNEAVMLKHHCSCGYLHTVLLERREKHRKAVNLPGKYCHFLPAGQETKGSITVKDISRAGLNFKLNENEKQNFVIGTKLFVEFHLDDEPKTLIKKEVIVRNIRGLHIGSEFNSVDLYDSALGLYMFT